MPKNSFISSRVDNIKPSPTMEVTSKARELKAAGKDIIGLGAGEPDFDTPLHIKEAAIKAIKDGQTKYTAVDGIPELKKAIINKFNKENNIVYKNSEVSVATGGKQILYNAFQATVNKGDEIIIPAPYWVSYPDMVILAQGNPVFIATKKENNFKVNVDMLEKVINEKTKWIILNSPSNPTGTCYSREELKEIGDFLKKYENILILTDDIYEKITYENFIFSTMAEVLPELKSRILTVNGVSKAYSMTGWRIGYGAGPKDIIKAMAKIQSQSTTNPSSISQAAAVEALNGTQDFIKTRSESFKERRDFVVESLNNIEGLSCLNPNGAFYVFPNCKKLLGKKTKLKTDKDFVEKLLEKSEVAVVQGSAFGLDGYFRISYATSMDNLKKALERIKSFCESLT